MDSDNRITHDKNNATKRYLARDDLVIDRTCTKFGARSFAVAAPLEWCRLPHHIRALQSIDSFKAALKTYLFDCS